MFSCSSREHGDDYELIQSQPINELVLIQRADSRFQLDLGLDLHKENASVCSLLFRLNATLWSTSLAAISGELASLHHKSNLKEHLKMLCKSILGCPVIPRMGIPGSYQGNHHVLKPLILTTSLWSLWRAESSSLSELRNNFWWNLVEKQFWTVFQSENKYIAWYCDKYRASFRWYECTSKLVCNSHDTKLSWKR